jgi:hypothetical protein
MGRGRSAGSQQMRSATGAANPRWLSGPHFTTVRGIQCAERICRGRDLPGHATLRCHQRLFHAERANGVCAKVARAQRTPTLGHRAHLDRSLRRALEKDGAAMTERLIVWVTHRGERERWRVTSVMPWARDNGLAGTSANPAHSRASSADRAGDLLHRHDRQATETARNQSESCLLVAREEVPIVEIKEGVAAGVIWQ